MVLDNGLIDIHSFWRPDIRIPKIAIHFSTTVYIGRKFLTICTMLLIDKLLERPTPQMLSRIKRHFASHWVDVGYELLTTTPEDVGTIQHSNKTENEKCFDMLTRWVETDANASYSKLIDALNVYDLNIAIEKVIGSISSL